jgi:glycosyltransferase involved in cell wall biosynthesis
MTRVAARLATVPAPQPPPSGGTTERGVRVLHLIASMNGGGAERQLAMLAGAQMRDGHDVHVALHSGGSTLPLLEGSGAQLHWLPPRGNHDARLLVDVARVVRALSPDLIQTWLPQMDVVGGTVARALGVPWILSERSSAGAYPATLKSRLRRVVARNASAVVANSATGSDVWAHHAPGTRPRFVVRNAIDYGAIRAARLEDPLGLGRYVLYAGRLQALKNIPVVLTALRRVVSGCPDVSAVLCGEGPERHLVDAAVADEGFSGKLRYLGFRPDVWALMREAAALVSVSLVEGQPNVVLEAMAAGCPLVVSDIPSHREIVDETCAWIVPPNDPDAVAEALLDATRNPARAARLAAAAQLRVQAYTPEAAAAQYGEIYGRVVASARAARGGGR